jgi:asparagine synthase (glutamine-hydrolysing)
VEFRLTQERFRQGLDAALESLDQPTFDAINTYFVSRVVREAGFTVALAGTGGDELFGGYPTFRELPAACTAAGLLQKVPPRWFEGLAHAASRLMYGKPGEVPPQTRWAKLGALLGTGGDAVRAYQVAYGLYTPEFLAQLMLAQDDQTVAGLPSARWRELKDAGRGKSGAQRVSQLELAMFVGERLLRDSDAASMAVSLELRVPLLDHRVVEAVQAVRDELRFRPLGKKRLLRQLALDNVDPTIFDRPKAGFVLPIEVWAKDSLSGTIDELFGDDALVRSVGLDPSALRGLWRAFRGGAKGMYWSRIWSPLVLLTWCRRHQVSVA